MSTLLVGFDSAWTPTNSGALIGVLRADDGTFNELGAPQEVNYHQAEHTILDWQSEFNPGATIVLLDQPTIVRNVSGQRPVEHLVSSPVGRRYGGMQPANTSRNKMFGIDAPVWAFLTRFGGPAFFLEPMKGALVIETYPVLILIALGWILPDSRPTGRLPKYNPALKKRFSSFDWQYLCQLASSSFHDRGLHGVAEWLNGAPRIHAPHKRDQDGMDACLCLLVALYLVESRECLMVGDFDTGYIVVPYGESLFKELVTRCEQTGRAPSKWVRSFHLSAAEGSSAIGWDVQHQDPADGSENVIF